MRKQHPAWRLLSSDHAPLAVSFLHRVFIAPNVRTLRESRLAEALEDDLHALRLRLGDDSFPRRATAYLNDWAGHEKGWLRKFYVSDSDEPHFDLVPAVEKAIAWISSLVERSFVGTESRLLTMFDLLSQMSEGSETDPAARVEALLQRRDEIDREIKRIEEGDVPMLDDAALKDRFQQFTQLARELLTDFREVEQNFRLLDRDVRKQIATWEGAKGALLDTILGARDTISDSDQGKSFHAFWDFLMSTRTQEDLTRLLDRVLALPAVADMNPDARLRRVHYDWLEAGEQTQRTVAQLSQQLRRFLDDQAWLENRRIMNILQSIVAKSVEIKDDAPAGHIMSTPDIGASIRLPMERPLFSPPADGGVADVVLQVGNEDADLSALFSSVVVDRNALLRQIEEALRSRSQVTLLEIMEMYPLEHGLAEVITYLHLASERKHTTVDDQHFDRVQWDSRDGVRRGARFPRVILARV